MDHPARISGDDNVPVITEQQERFTRLGSLFRAKFRDGPAFIVRVPGRVNLIGEHIDYCGFGVLPMAIEQDTLLAVRANDDSMLRLTNMDSVNFPDIEISLNNFTFSIPPAWYHYLLCGIQGAKDLLGSTSFSLTGLNIAVWGTIPPSAGLSSSSALVIGSLLAAYYSVEDRKCVSKLEIADTAAKCERYVGTQGGAMDQSIAMFAHSGFAKFIEFEPTFQFKDVLLPDDVCFFFSHSGLTCNKAATQHFNVRVFETRVASLMVTKYCSLKSENSHITCPTLSQVKKHLGKSYDEMVAIVNEAIESGKAFTADDLVNELKLKDTNELANLLSNGSVPSMERMQKIIEDVSVRFKVNDRAIHVFSEAQRVAKVVNLCTNKDFPSEKISIEMGKLMNESHESCCRLYECSHPELDSLVTKALSFGALGARMTGAGWGGGIVSMVPKSKSDSFLQSMSKVSKYTIASSPGPGAIIYPQ